MTQYINLVNPAFRRQRDPLSALSLAAVLGVMFVLLASAHALVKQRTEAVQGKVTEIEAQLRADQERLVSAGRAVAGSKATPTLAAEVEVTRAAVLARQNAMAALASGAIGDTGGFSEQFRAFARQSMPGLWLTAFTLSGAGKDILIRGRALSADLIPAYIRRLNGEPAFKGRSFAALVIEESKTEDARLAAPLSPPNPPPSAATKKPAIKAEPYLDFQLVSSTDLGAKFGKTGREAPALRALGEMGR